MQKLAQRWTTALPGWLNTTLIIGAFGTLLWLEKRRPLRRHTECKRTRDTRNLAVAALSATTIWLTERPVTSRLTQLVDQHQWGLVRWLGLPAWLEVLLAVLLLDYTLYLWHVLTHKVPWLWRFHRVHYTDLDLSASTALRFHCTEMIASVPWRVAQVVAIGASPLTLAVWQITTLLAILFHHANVAVPVAVEQWLCRLIVTPRMHGIHHSIIRNETDANWSTIFSWPDYLHRTIRLNVPQQAITTGVPAYREPRELTFRQLIAVPFRRQRPTWQPPGDGQPARGALPETATDLAGGAWGNSSNAHRAHAPGWL
jgi:sterol desaturase/sphingolipid hydroxylase (fatty acid hydroxylase superfamily)